MISISSRREGSATVMQVKGRIDAVTAPGFERACLEVMRGSEKLMVIDFGEVLFLSSAGLRSLLVVSKKLWERGGVLRLANIPRGIGQVFELSNFYSLLPHFDSVEKAIEE